MQVNFEQAIEIIKTLPPEDFRRLDEWFEEQKRADEQARTKEARLKYQIERYKKARRWLDEHSGEFMNEWVCLEGDRLVAHGADALEVHRQAKKAGIEIPFVHHIVPEYDMGA
ncbi:MAG: DUF5678 domain-containing protein [Pyrinomonadaceae bacterium]